MVVEAPSRETLADIYGRVEARAAKRGQSPVTAYAEAVVDGEIPAGRRIVMAAERHLRDLATAHERRLRFDEAEAARAIKFFELLPHTKGEWARRRQRLTLALWQKFCVGSVFGWLRADGSRRFRTVYEEIPRKNGKTTKCAGVGLLLAFFDREPGAEVYSTATKRDQAKIVWNQAVEMVQRSEPLRKRIRVQRENLHSTASFSKFEPLSADAKTADGLNPHGTINDEVHAHTGRDLLDKMEEASGARRQPLRWDITTAGYDKHSICWEQHEYGVRILDQVLDDDSFFVFIAGADVEDVELVNRYWSTPDDDVDDELRAELRLVFMKTNPNFGISVYEEELLEKCDRAGEIIGRRNSFLRQRMNVWTEQQSRFIDLALWDAQEDRDAVEELYGAECFGMLDLSSTQDLTSLSLFFPDTDGHGDVVQYFWVPEEGMRKRAQRDRVPYDVWVSEGFIKATEGNVVDYRVIRQDINDAGLNFNIREIAYDRWNASQLVTELQGDGFTMVPMGQGFASMTGPTREFERLLLEHGVRHGGNPVLRWMATNVVVREDPAGNIKPDKERSAEKIDGIVTVIGAIGRAAVNLGEERSQYEDGDGVMLV